MASDSPRDERLMVRLLVIRHGNSVTNAERRYTGQLDAPLSELGEQQALQLADYLVANEPLDAIYASDLSRAVRTIEPTATRMGLPIRLTPALRETDVGEWTGRTYEDIKQNYPDLFLSRKDDPSCPYPGGESDLSVFERVRAVLDEILQAHEGERIALVTHAFPARIIETLSDGQGAYEVRRHRVAPNASLRIYTYENGKLTSTGPNIVSYMETDGVKLPTELV